MYAPSTAEGTTLKNCTWAPAPVWVIRNTTDTCNPEKVFSLVKSLNDEIERCRAAGWVVKLERAGREGEPDELVVSLFRGEVITMSSTGA